MRVHSYNPMVPPHHRSNPLKRVQEALCLVALLIVGQQGALVHELSHASGAHVGDLRATPVEASVCALCLSFAQVASPTLSHAIVLPKLLRPEPSGDSVPLVTAVESANPTPRSRGPPSQS
jgi:hypothetical protein